MGVDGAWTTMRGTLYHLVGVQREPTVTSAPTPGDSICVIESGDKEGQLAWKSGMIMRREAEPDGGGTTRVGAGGSTVPGVLFKK